MSEENASPSAASSVDPERSERPEDESSLQPTIVVGIGASAGGIEALQGFFSAVPTDLGLAFAVVVHLSPEHRSHLASIIGARTTMPVEQVTSTVPLKGNHVYVIPPDRQLQIADGQIGVYPFDEPRGQRAPIDLFFRSLAEQHGDGFGIILSGGGSDGAAGVKAIKAAGGLVLVQDPAEATHKSMPRAAIATHVADLVLPVRELAARLAELTHAKRRLLHSVVAGSQAPLGKNDEALLGRILAHLHARTGHDFARYKRGTVLRRLARRMQVQRTESFGDYLAFLRQNATESQALFNDLLISVTGFFRDPAAWQGLAEQVIPKLFDQEQSESKIRVWVPGCATGEEAYSIAILLLEEAHRRDVWPQVQIFASDLDEGALGIAREGRFPATIAADVTEERLDRFFRKSGDHYRVTKEVRDCVLFTNHSLLRDPPFSRLDLVCCRNLLIYLDRELQQQVFGIFHYALRPGRYLFLGASETSEVQYFRSLDKKHRIYVGREVVGQQAPPLPPMLLSAPRIRAPAPRDAQPAPPTSPDVAHRAMLEELAPPSVLVDESGSALHLSETAGRFLRTPGGALTRDLTRLVHPELQIELRAALARALERREGSLSPFINVHFEGGVRRVAMLVRPRDGSAGEPLALVIFIEGGASDDLAPVIGITDEADRRNEAVQRLQGELRALQEQLARVREDSAAGTEELRASNEELQSVNEEYRSTAEELETSKEELQSINEELETVNHELKLNLNEITRAHSDLENLMAATEVGTLFLDRALRIARVTPPLLSLFNVTAGDCGRPIGDFTHRLEYSTLDADARLVMERLVPIEREVRATDGRWFLMRIRPYRTVEDKIDGVVVTFVDFTARRTAEEALRQSEERYRLLVEGVEEYAILMVDVSGVITTWNPGAARIFGRSESEAVGQPVDVLFSEEDRAAGTPEREMETAASQGTASDDSWQLRKDGSRFWASGVMTALRDSGGRLRSYAKILRDNTERREAEAARFHFQVLFDSAPGMYLVLKPADFRIVAVSEAYLEATHTRRDELVGRVVFDILPDASADPANDGKQTIRASLERVKSARRADTMAMLRFTIRRPAGDGDGEGDGVNDGVAYEERWWSPVHSPVFDPSGELAYIIQRVEDVTPFVQEMRDQGREAEGHQMLERRAQLMETEIGLRVQEVQRANELLRRLTAQLQQQAAERELLLAATQEAREEADAQRAEAQIAGEAKLQFLTTMSHELRTPLNAIAGHVQLLEMELHGPISHAQRDALTRVQRAQQHLMGLINDVLNFARLETGTIEYDLQPTDLGEVMADVAPMIEPQLAAKGVQYELRLPDTPAVVWGEADKIRQILINLLGNAVKFTPPGGRVLVDVGFRSGTPHVTYLRVQDTGIGVPRTRQPLIFDPFVQAHRSLTHPTEGTGLGLAISRDLARGMGGDLRVRSTEGQGSTFTLTLRRFDDTVEPVGMASGEDGGGGDDDRGGDAGGGAI